MLRGLIAFVVVASFCGCTHNQLRRSTIGQVRTLADINHQQVLDNVAMFCCSPNSMPFFALPKAGLTQVDDTGEATGTLIWQEKFLQETLGIKGTRRVAENWTLEPINDPAKLHRMRCAYQWAVCGMMPCDECENCFVDLSKFYQEPDRPECHIPPQGWFCTGKRRDVPKDACYVSHCGDCYVWVDGEGMNSLTRLTLTILDLALNVPNNPKQEVTRFWEPKRDVHGEIIKDEDGYPIGYEIQRIETKGSEKQRKYGDVATEKQLEEDKKEELKLLPRATDTNNKRPSRFVPSEKVRDFNNFNLQSVPFAIPPG